MTPFEEEAEALEKLKAEINKYKNKRKPISFDKLFALFSLFAFVGLPLIWLYGIFAYGFVITKMWVWFIIPTFHTDIKLGIIQAAGLYMFVKFFTNQHKVETTNPKETKSDKINKIAIPIFLPWLTFFFAWLLHLLM